jgi:hypothetical protein
VSGLLCTIDNFVLPLQLQLRVMREGEVCVTWKRAVSSASLQAMRWSLQTWKGAPKSKRNPVGQELKRDIHHHSGRRVTVAVAAAVRVSCTTTSCARAIVDMRSGDRSGAGVHNRKAVSGRCLSKRVERRGEIVPSPVAPNARARDRGD